MMLLTPDAWQSYELLDFGDFEKLERFGEYVLIRPEPQAVVSKHLKASEWQKRSSVAFLPKSANSGEWVRSTGSKMPDRWQITYQSQKLSLKFRLALTGFKHIGIFPEQAANWEFIASCCGKLKKPKVLNLFAYTGGATLAAAYAGAEVTHVDSVKQVVTWANDNRELNRLGEVRWMVEDALRFAQREVRRGNVYQGIILDPPAYGIGASGERWKLEEKINELVEVLSQLLDPQQGFLVFNAYSMGFSPLILETLLSTHFRKLTPKQLEFGELYFSDLARRRLPMGVFARFSFFNPA
jgi:23S rRNA (cytosine1962-C5)-methyltransferase